MAKLAIDKATYREQVARLCAEAGAREVAEIGVWQAALSIELLKAPTVRNLYMIDPWVSYDSRHITEERMRRALNEAIKRTLDDPRAKIICLPSVDAAHRFADGSLDFIHIDADHEEKEVTRDILAWRPKIRPGGLLTGDDYQLPSVAAAVDHALPERNLCEGGRVWWWRRP